MASAKAILKAAKSALDNNAFDEAEHQARLALDIDASNYFATLFLGRALEKQGKLEEAIRTYEASTKIKPSDELAWKGLCTVYQLQEAKGVDNYTSAGLRLAEVYVQNNDQEKCQTTVDGLVSYAKEHGSRSQYMTALKAYLPDSPVYDFLEGRIPNPAFTYTRLADITETDEKEKINKEVGERRTRLGAKLGQVQLDVKREVYRKSELEEFFQKVINWTSNDEERRNYEEKLLEHAHDHMIVLLGDDKVLKRRRVQELAHGMVIIKHPFKLAWDIEFEWKDIDELSSLDRNVLLEYIQFFPKTGLSRILQGYLGEKLKQPKSTASENDNRDETEEGQKTETTRKLDPEEQLLLIDDGISESTQSAFAHRLVADYYLRIAEYESCVDTSRKALKLLRAEGEKIGMRLTCNQDAVSSCLGTSLVYYQAPKNHPEARSIFDELLSRKLNLTPALLGIGLIFEEQEDFEKASGFLDRASARDTDDIVVEAEAAWCTAQNGELEAGLKGLVGCLSKLEAQKTSPRELKSQVFYRVGICLWRLHTDKASRKDRNGPYSYFISAIRANPSYAPAYTSLGMYYTDYARDRKRARQCFQKAFELSASEIKAAEYLATSFAKEADWDIVEAVAQRAIDSGAVKPTPGSKRKAVSWPFAALGVVQMNKQQYPQAVHSYQSALRISPADYHSWVGLGESYLSSGRYNAASKALEHAREMPTDSSKTSDKWFADYMHSNVLRELGEYAEAIAGYKSILHSRPQDFGVSIALLQTMVEYASDCIHKGFFSNAARSAGEALNHASRLEGEPKRTINFWKAVGDACMIYTDVPQLVQEAPEDTIANLLSSLPKADASDWKDISDIDQIPSEILARERDRSQPQGLLMFTSAAGIFAQKLAIYAASNDVHAKAIAWYNLGWAEYQASRLSQGFEPSAPWKGFSSCANAAVRCFKRAIELEAGNSDFWNALGVATTTLSPKIAQHSLVRSLHINERSPQTWSNLGILYLTLEDYELAHEAFSKSQSTDPDFVPAWLGEGLVALSLGDSNEAASHFEHAFEIADASAVAAKQHFVSIAFEKLLADKAQSSIDKGIMSIFALQQLQNQTTDQMPHRHLLALLLEQAGDYDSAVYHLASLSDQLEALYEETESSLTLGQFVRIKADLARDELAARSFENAVSNASTALDLSEEADEQAMSPHLRNKTRLSAHLTAGTANVHLSSVDEAIPMFRLALDESGNDPDVVCLLTQVLWAKGSESEKASAKEQLFGVIETSPGHVDVTSSLGALSLLDADTDTHEAVMSDLPSLREDANLNPLQKERIDKLQILSTELAGSDEDTLSEIQRAIMVDPSRTFAWSSLRDVSGDLGAAETALLTATQRSLEGGIANSELLAETMSEVGRAADAQRSMMLCPWLASG